MVDFQSGLWYSEGFNSFCMWYIEKPFDDSEQLAYYQSISDRKWVNGECCPTEGDRLVVDFLLTSWL